MGLIHPHDRRILVSLGKQGCPSGLILSWICIRCLENIENIYIIIVPKWWFNGDLGGGLNPSEEFSQIGSFPQVGVKIKKYLKPPPSDLLW